MTVVAYKAGVMAADTMLSSFNSQSRAQKIVRLQDGGVAGGAGHWPRAYAGLKYLAAGGDPDSREDAPNMKEAAIMLVKPDGSIWLIEGEFPAFPLLDKVAAIGCGSDAALMAMTLGLSAVEAVSKVTRQDVLCGDPVQSLELYSPVEYPGVRTHCAEPKAKRKKK